MASKTKTKKLKSDLYIVTKRFSDDLPDNWDKLNRGERVACLVAKYRALADAIKKRFPKVKIVDVLSIAVTVVLPPREAEELRKEIETKFECELARDVPVELIEPVRKRTKKSKKS